MERKFYAYNKLVLNLLSKNKLKEVVMIRNSLIEMRGDNIFELKKVNSLKICKIESFRVQSYCIQLKGNFSLSTYCNID